MVLFAGLAKVLVLQHLVLERFIWKRLSFALANFRKNNRANLNFSAKFHIGSSTDGIGTACLENTLGQYKDADRIAYPKSVITIMMQSDAAAAKSAGLSKRFVQQRRPNSDLRPAGDSCRNAQYYLSWQDRAVFTLVNCTTLFPAVLQWLKFSFRKFRLLFVWLAVHCCYVADCDEALMTQLNELR